MDWKNYSSLKGSHAAFGPSSYHWINYDNDKFLQTWINMQAKERGTRIHDVAAELIDLKIKLPRSNHKTLNMYVNDAIGYGMRPEQPLYYSPYFYGTADAICFDEKKNLLRIHDLKTGVSGHMEQVKVYAALFCLDYRKKPAEIEMELRLYKNGEVIIDHPDPDEITHIMDKIVTFDRIISSKEAAE